MDSESTHDLMKENIGFELYEIVLYTRKYIYMKKYI